MGFPCNQFGNQEPEDEASIKKFVVDNFGVSFPMFSKVNMYPYGAPSFHLPSLGFTPEAPGAQVEVNGLNTHPVYEFLKADSQFGADVEWNFVKFVVDRNGNVVRRFKSPFDRVELETEIEALLGPY
jgi:glutathione peroxidase